MNSINARFSIFSKYQIIWEELIYIWVFPFLEMKNNGMREKRELEMRS